MRALRPVLTGSLVISLLFGALAPGAGADADQVIDDALAWLIDQQQEDGSFEVAGFDGFETPDAVLAIAAEAQTGDWNEAAALAAVKAVQADDGTTALDWIDDWVEDAADPPGAGQRAKLILQVAAPLGLEPTAFDPAVNGTPIDLTAGLDTVDPAVFNTFLFARLADTETGRHVHQVDLQLVCEGQRAGGGWGYDGLPDGTAPDYDTTGFAVMALIAAGVPVTDPVLVAASAFVEAGQQPSGAWRTPPTFGDPVDDPNTTALALIADAALDTGADVDGAMSWLRTRQEPEGNIASPNDGFGVNTFATSQAIQALLLDQAGADWLPRPPADDGRRCLAPHTYSDVPANAWYDDGARWAAETGIVAGFDGAMKPKGSVKRQQAAMWLNLMFGGIGGDPHPFVDIPANAWYREGVNFVGGAPNGVIATGYGNKFRPKLTLNRGQAASWLYAAAGSPPVHDLAAHGFTDVGPNRWYEDAVTWAKANGVATGFPDNTFRGKGNVNRAQFAQWMFTLAATPEAWSESAVIAPTNLFGAP